MLFCLISCSSATCKTKSSCNGKAKTSANKLKTTYKFIEKPHAHKCPSSRKRRSDNQNRNKWCPWTWEVESIPNGEPSTIAVAKCNNCDSTICIPMYFYHKFLIKVSKCDNQTGDEYRIWSSVHRPIAYVYKKY